MFTNCRALACTCGGRFRHRRVATQPLPDLLDETNFPQRKGQLRGWPARALPGGASGNGYQYSGAAEQIRKLRVAKARPIHNACVAGKPLRVTCLQPCAQLTRRLAHSPGGAWRIDVARCKRETRPRKLAALRPLALRRVLRLTIRAPLLRAASIHAPRSGGRRALRYDRDLEAARPFPPPSAAGATTPPAPGAEFPQDR